MVWNNAYDGEFTRKLNITWGIFCVMPRRSC